jgi:hypothetical protein
MSPKPTKQNEQDFDLEQGLLDQLTSDDEQSEIEEKRDDPRSRLVKVGQLEVGDEKFPCFIVDLSKTGTKIRTLEPLEAELSKVRLHIAEIGVFDAEVRWVDGAEIGLLLQQEIEAPEEQESADIEDVLRIQNQK